MKRFNTYGKCNPKVHYMVNIDKQVEAAAKLVRQGDYFCINRGRQYGKTTTLALLTEKLKTEGYIVFSISFEGMDDESFESLGKLTYATLRRISSYLKWEYKTEIPAELDSGIKDLISTKDRFVSSDDFSDFISSICQNNKVVLIIDEVDQASNYESFIKFLGLLRDLFLKRDKRPTLQSVVLAGVYDIKNLKLKIRPEEQHQYNSPWNIAASFNVEMSLSEDGIAGMLREYKEEHNIKLEDKIIANLIYGYTSGYPFLVTRLCQIIDEESLSWDKDGVLKAVNNILKEENTLFDDLNKKINQFPNLKKLLRSILYTGEKKSYSPDEQSIQLARRFSFLKEEDGNVKIFCRLMETRLYNLFLAEEDTERMFISGQDDKNQFVHDGYIDMKHLLERFCVHFNDIFRTKDGQMDMEFIEKQGRKQFLLYMRPIINGIGNYYIESETRDNTRTDVIIDYLGKQYVIELKIWRGESYNQRGEKQLVEYLDFYHQSKGYMVSFCFNKGKQSGVHTVQIGNREITEAIV